MGQLSDSITTTDITFIVVPYVLSMATLIMAQHGFLCDVRALISVSSQYVN